MMATRQNLISTWGSKNITFFEETIWSSSIQQTDLPQVRDFLETNNFNFFDISIIRPQEPDFGRIKWKYHYDATGQCIGTNYQNRIELNSNHLKLTVGLTEQIDKKECQDITISIISLLRIVFGVPIARELIKVNHYHKNNPIGNTQSEEGFASYFLNQDLNMFPDISSAKVKNIPVEASVLLDKALQQKYPTECFILMWTSFESIINNIEQGKNNGIKRRNYFDKLGSTLVNDEVERLYKEVRCNIFKQGKDLSIKDIENENWSLYAILQLTIMEECPVRTKFLKGYENLLEERNSLSRIKLEKEQSLLQ